LCKTLQFGGCLTVLAYRDKKLSVSLCVFRALHLQNVVEEVPSLVMREVPRGARGWGCPGRRQWRRPTSLMKTRAASRWTLCKSRCWTCRLRINATSRCLPSLRWSASGRLGLRQHNCGPGDRYNVMGSDNGEAAVPLLMEVKPPLRSS
jgi:hypothetical protein